jgi:hypothetical protein
MSVPEWSVVGYYRYEDDVPSFGAPIFRKLNSEELFLQTSYLDVDKFDLISVSGEFDRLANHVEISDPYRTRVICLVTYQDVFVSTISDLKKRLIPDLGDASLPISFRLQIADLLGDEGSRTALEARLIASDDESLLSLGQSILSNTFYETVMSSVRETSSVREAFKIASSVSKKVSSASLDDLSDEDKRSLTTITALTLERIEEVLAAKLKALEGSEQFSISAETQVGQVAKMLQDIRGASRQELRISRILASLLQHPAAAQTMLRQYKPWTKAETEALRRVLPRINNIAESDKKGRSYLVATLVHDVMKAQFGARRGQLLEDLAQTLGDDEVVREAIISEYKRRQHTWSVHAMDQPIRRALRLEDQGAAVSAT